MTDERTIAEMSAGMTAIAGIPAARVRPADAAQSQPGMYQPSHRRSTFELDHPALASPTVPTGSVLSVNGRHQAPVLFGALAHQIAHQVHTGGAPGWRSPGLLEVLSVFEELRVEAAHIRERPQDAKYLMVHAVATTPPPAHAARWLLASYAALTLGRVDAGIYPDALVAGVREELRRNLTARSLSGLRQLWQDAINVDDGDGTTLEGIANAWVRRVGGPPPGVRSATCMTFAKNLPARAEGEYEDPYRPDVDANLTAAASALHGHDTAALFAAGVQESAESARLRQARQEAARAESTERAARKARKVAERALAAFPHNDHDDPDVDESEDDGEEGAAPARDALLAVHDKGGKDRRRGPSKSIAFREPDPDDWALAAGMARTFERAKFRDVARTHHDSHVPPGRLRGREMVMREVQRQNRMTITAKPFRVSKRRRTPEPPLLHGVMVDTSGSMSWASSIFGSFAWASSQAMKNLDGRFAAVTFGGKPKPMVVPGRPPTRVREYRGSGGNERFREGFQLVDGLVRLSDAKEGARVLTVVSDGRYVSDEVAAAETIVAGLRRAGALVLWVSKDVHAALVPAGAVRVEAEPYASLPTRLEHAIAEQLRQA